MSSYEHAVEALINVGRYAHQCGWVPATSGNLSVRLEDAIAVTVSGAHKGRLGPADVMRVDFDGRPLEDKRPSAETLLHAQIYRHDPAIGCVLHTHSVNSTVLSRLIGDALILEGLELLKAFPGVGSHEVRMRVPVFANDQDMGRLAAAVAAYLAGTDGVPAYLIEGHGLYTWGASVSAALRHLEALEFLFQCELEMRRIRA